MGKQPITDEREQLRQLMREAHETIKDLRLLLREYQQARAGLDAAADKLLEGALNSHIEEISTALNDATAHVQKVIRNQEEQTRRHYGELLGKDTADLILRTCGMVLHLSVPRITVEGWMEQLKRDGLQHQDTGCSCLGCMTVAAATADPYQADVVVTTPDMLGEVQKRNPDRIVIDMR